jgi:hypothetical protein
MTGLPKLCDDFRHFNVDSADTGPVSDLSSDEMLVRN